MLVEARGPLPIGWRGRGPTRAAMWGGRPAAPLRLSFGLLERVGKNRHLGFCFVQFREYFQNSFSETKNSRKQELALWHLVNRLVMIPKSKS